MTVTWSGFTGISIHSLVKRETVLGHALHTGIEFQSTPS